jgi:hypothetical protein
MLADSSRQKMIPSFPRYTEDLSFLGEIMLFRDQMTLGHDDN